PDSNPIPTPTPTPTPTPSPLVHIHLDPAFAQDQGSNANSSVGTIDGQTSIPGATVTLLRSVSIAAPGALPAPGDVYDYVAVQTATADGGGNFQFTGVTFSHASVFLAFVSGPTPVSTPGYEIDGPGFP